MNQRKKRSLLIISIILLLLLGGLGFSYKYSQKKQEKAQEKVSRLSDFFSQTQLYKITGPGLEKPSYLYGTHHVQPHDFVLPNQVAKVIAKTDQLATEINYDTPTNRARMDKLYYSIIKRKYYYKGLATRRAINYLKDQREKDSLWYIMHPIVLYLLEENQPPPKSPEKILYEKYQRDNKSREGLEYIGEWVTIGLKIKSEEDKLYIKEEIIDRERFEIRKTLSMLDTSPEQQKKYLSEVDKIRGKFASDSDEEDFKPQVKSSYFPLFIKERNALWLPKMIKMMKAKPTLFTVGALHLPEEPGLIQLLIDAGYTVQKVQEDGRVTPLDYVDYHTTLQIK